MTDIFAIRTPRQRRVLIGVLVVYAALFVTDLTAGNQYTAAALDLLFSVLVLTACVVAAGRISDARTTETLTGATVATFALAGLAIGYEGLATLGIVPASALIERVGTLALLATFGLYFYDRYA